MKKAEGRRQEAEGRKGIVPRDPYHSPLKKAEGKRQEAEGRKGIVPRDPYQSPLKKAEGKRQEAEGRKGIVPRDPYHSPEGRRQLSIKINLLPSAVCLLPFLAAAKRKKPNLLFTLLFLLSVFLTQSLTGFMKVGMAQMPASTPTALVQQALSRYEVGQYTEAIAILQQAIEAFKSEGNEPRQAMALSNLSLTYQQLGQWQEAEDAILASIELLQPAQTPEQLKLLGAALDIQGQLYLAQGKEESALDSFSQAVATYKRTNDETGLLRTQINQSQALVAFGFYRRALNTLQQVNTTLQQQPDSPIKAIGLRSLGNTLRLIGNLNQSQDVLQQSLAIANTLQSPQDISAALLALGNTARALSDSSKALNYYQQAADAARTIPSTRIQAQLNQLSLLVDTKEPIDPALLQDIQLQITQLPASRTAVEARINLARSLMKLEAGPNFNTQDIAQQLATALQQAKSLGDLRTESYALGQLGALYQQTQQFGTAQELTEQALVLAQSLDAADIAYGWQWQLGRLLKEQGKIKQAIAAYTAAFNSLQSLRRDLVSINPDIQFSFRESVEPVYRELVSLLLQPQPGDSASQDNLVQARNVIEALQQAELVNFFREDCLNATPIQIDQVDRSAAVIYPIVLNDRIEVVLSLPNAPLRHYATPKSKKELEDVFADLRDMVAPYVMDARGVTITVRPRGNAPLRPRYLPLAQQVYDWLIRPAEQELAASGVKTLVFVLDGPMLNLPMAVLHDGQQFLIENYAIAYTPGLQLIDPQPLLRGELSALKGGLSQARQDFPPLPNVQHELEQIRLQVGGDLLFNETFTSTALQQQMDAVPFRVVHLATHGQFSSNAEDTFILTWDSRLDVNQLSNVLRAREEGDTQALELLVLSACQTAAGDQRAALGLAGVAVKAGARSTLATLWFVDDAATAEFMIRFYRELADTTITKAEALRRAQVALLQESQYQQPVYWAPFVLVGNWL